MVFPPQERIPERTREQVVDGRVPQVVEQIIEVPKMVEEILDVLVPEMDEQSVKLPKTVSEDGIQQRTADRIADIPVPQDVEEKVEVSEVFLRTGFNSVLWSRPMKLLILPSLRRSLGSLSLSRKERHNRL